MKAGTPGFVIPTELDGDLVHLQLLKENDFDGLYAVASDPLIWEQHPNPDRYKRPVFETYFRGAIESGSAYLVYDSTSGKVIGCSRFYDYNETQRTVSIGYTFLSRECWGKGFNLALKSVMLEHAFRFVEAVFFHVGNKNYRSRKAMEKLGAVNTGEADMSYYGEQPHTNVIYRIDRSQWYRIHPGNSQY
jgi:RimJ/RimL family protein N-acetyltransferase